MPLINHSFRLFGERKSRLKKSPPLGLFSSHRSRSFLPYFPLISRSSRFRSLASFLSRLSDCNQANDFPEISRLPRFSPSKPAKSSSFQQRPRSVSNRRFRSERERRRGRVRCVQTKRRSKMAENSACWRVERKETKWKRERERESEWEEESADCLSGINRALA